MLAPHDLVPLYKQNQYIYIYVYIIFYNYHFSNRNYGRKKREIVIDFVYI